MNGELEAAAAAAMRQVECSREVGGSLPSVHMGQSNLAFVESLLGRYEDAIGRLQEVVAEMHRLREPNVGDPLEHLALAFGLRCRSR